MKSELTKVSVFPSWTEGSWKWNIKSEGKTNQQNLIIVCFVTKRFKPHCEDLTSGTIALKLPGRRKRSSPCEAPHEHWGVPDHTLQQTREGENRLRHGKSSIGGFYMWVLALRMAMVSPGRKQYYFISIVSSQLRFLNYKSSSLFHISRSFATQALIKI